MIWKRYDSDCKTIMTIVRAWKINQIGWLINWTRAVDYHSCISTSLEGQCYSVAGRDAGVFKQKYFWCQLVGEVDLCCVQPYVCTIYHVYANCATARDDINILVPKQVNAKVHRNWRSKCILITSNPSFLLCCDCISCRLLVDNLLQRACSSKWHTFITHCSLRTVYCIASNTRINSKSSWPLFRFYMASQC